jgi:hypothetical protein
MGDKPRGEPFVTIDDLTRKAQELVDGLHKLGSYKHPLDIRRGVPTAGEGVSETMAARKENKDSLQVKGGGRTYFLDMARTSKDTPYLRITESRKGEGEEFERSSIYVFPEDAQKFNEAVQEMTARLEE